MRAKREIEHTLEHLKSPACTADAAINAVWIEALEWVLGDAAHREAYAEWLRQIEPPPLRAADAAVTGATARELVLQHSLFMALTRLR